MASRPSNLTAVLARAWFPLALVGLLLLGLPGLLLFILNLVGEEHALNRWLQEAFHVTYHIPLPGAGMLLLLLVPFAIALLYFLKRKRKPLSVPSTFLWRKSVEDLHVNSLFQWLRENVLLLLQLLAVLALVYGVMAFHLHGRSGAGKHYILMIDNSASMSATDVAPSRLEQAKQAALREIDSYSDNDFGMVIVFNARAEIRQSFTGNCGELRRAVERIEPTQKPTRIEEALSLADSWANPLHSTEDRAARPENEEPGKERTYAPPTGIPTDLHLFSDGRFPDLSEAALANFNSRAAGNESALGNLHLQFHLAGKPGAENVDNVGVVAFSAGRNEQDPAKLDVLLRAANFRSSAVTTQVELEVYVNGKLKAILPARPLTLPARNVVAAGEGTPPEDTPGEGRVTFALSEMDERSGVVLHARLLDLHDQFPLDDEAWLVAGVVHRARVLLVGPPNEVLEAFFDDDATRQVATVTKLAPDDLGKDVYRKTARNGAYDLVIFDRCGPGSVEEMPWANTFFIGQPPPPWKPADLPRLEFPAIRGWDKSHPVLHDLAALYQIGIRQAFRIDNLPPHTPRLIESDREALLLFSLNRQSFTDLVLTFPIITGQGQYNTDWPGNNSFPLFLRNVLLSLGNIQDAVADRKLQPGQVMTLRPDEPVPRLRVIGPGGKVHTLARDERDVRADFSFAETGQVGVYHAEWGGGQRSFAVNLLDAEESDIEPRSAFHLGKDQVTAGQDASQPREVWKWFAALALVVLLVEWYVYNRRIYI